MKNRWRPWDWCGPNGLEKLKPANVTMGVARMRITTVKLVPDKELVVMSDWDSAKKAAQALASHYGKTLAIVNEDTGVVSFIHPKKAELAE